MLDLHDLHFLHALHVQLFNFLYFAFLASFARNTGKWRGIVYSDILLPVLTQKPLT